MNSNQDASQAQGEVEEALQCLESFPSDPREVEGRITALGASRLDAAIAVLRAALSPAPGATAQDGVEEAEYLRRCELEQIADGAYGDGPFTRGAARDQLAAMKAQTPTIPAGMVAWGPNSPGYPAPPSDWDNKAVAWGDGTVDRGLIGDKAWERGKNPGGYIIAYTPLAAAPKQAEQQPVPGMYEPKE